MDTTFDLPASRRQIARARIAISVVFFMLGTGTGLWAVHIPLVTERLQIDPATLGLALFSMAIGAVISMPLTGWAVTRYGSRLPTRVTVLYYIATIAPPILSPSVPLLFVAAFLFGAGLGSTDVAMNTQAAELEKARGRPTMSSFHGFFSVGGLAGASLGAGMIAAGWGDGSGALVLAIIFFIIAAIAIRDLLWGEPVAEAGPRFSLPNRAVVGLGLIAFLAFAIEGAVTDWSALFLTTVRGASVTAAATGYAFFSLAMAIFRLAGDPIVARLGDRMVVIGGGVIMAVGVAIALIVPWPIVGAIGFALVGVGAANVVPVAFSGGGKTPGVHPSVGIASVVTLSYTGFLISPPILGFVGNAWGLSVSMGVVLAMAVLVAAGGLFLRRTT
jgi:MFS family permease